MKLEEAQKIAEKYKNLLKPFCERIEIAGSIRRKKPEVKDIEIVAIPKNVIGFSQVVNQWEKVKGEPSGKYTQRILPERITLDLFMATPRNWGLIFAMRTGSADFSHNILACGWVKNGYKSEKGMLKRMGHEIEVREEIDLFKIIHLAYIEPELRM